MYIKFIKRSHKFLWGTTYVAVMVNKFGETVADNGDPTTTSCMYKMSDHIRQKLYHYLLDRGYNAYLKDHYLYGEQLLVRVRSKADQATFAVLNVGVIEVERKRSELSVLKI
jgi:hypothetical protein